MFNDKNLANSKYTRIINSRLERVPSSQPQEARSSVTFGTKKLQTVMNTNRTKQPISPTARSASGIPGAKVNTGLRRHQTNPAAPRTTLSTLNTGRPPTPTRRISTAGADFRRITQFVGVGDTGHRLISDDSILTSEERVKAKKANSRTSIPTFRPDRVSNNSATNLVTGDDKTSVVNGYMQARDPGVERYDLTADDLTQKAASLDGSVTGRHLVDNGKNDADFDKEVS